MKYTLDRSVPEPSELPPQVLLDALESRFALRLAARLTESSAAIGSDVSERLRFAREQALGRAREARRMEAITTTDLSNNGSALLLGAGRGWGFRLAVALPVLALAFGLFGIQVWQDNAQISTAAEIDAALLADDLPPAAYSDAGFAEYLKMPPHE